MKITISDALSKLGISGIVKNNDYDTIKWFCEESEIPSKKTVEDKVAELQSAEDATQYQRTRAPLYPDIGDQLDDLYKKGAFSDEMAAKIKKVKDDNPKPS